MSRPITDLPAGALVNLMETNGGNTMGKPWRIIATADKNPYKNGVFMLRDKATGTGANESAFKWNNAANEVNYENSQCDIKHETELYGRFDEATKALIMPTAIKVYDNDAGEVVSINRHVFALSAREYGVDSYTTDTTENPGYFTDNASRKCYNDQGQAVGVWSRWPASASAVVCVGSYGGVFAYSPAYNICARPALILASNSLVSDAPNADGSYNLVLSDTIPPREVEFTALLGQTDKMPQKIKVECEYEMQSGTIEFWVCNNYNDPIPAWEKIELGEQHRFANATKAAEKWALGVKCHAQSENNITVYEPCAIVSF